MMTGRRVLKRLGASASGLFKRKPKRFVYFIFILFIALLLMLFMFWQCQCQCQPIDGRLDLAYLLQLQQAIRQRMMPINPIITSEDESIKEDFELFGNSSCSAVRKLFGEIDVTYANTTIEEMRLLYPDLELGGHYIPTCSHSEKVALIVPYRDRFENLGIFLYNIHKILKRQQIEYQIFIVEQVDKEPFNRGTLFNVGFVEASKLFNFTCVIFHDVNLIPDDDRNIYRCPPKHSGRHMAGLMSNQNYTLPYAHFFGGVVALNKQEYKQMNGCSNRFWGWGGEDDDMINRVKNQKWKITRYSQNVTRYTMLGHKRVPTQEGSILLRQVRDGSKYFQTSGLSDLNYTLIKIDSHWLYTCVQVRLYFPGYSVLNGS